MGLNEKLNTYPGSRGGKAPEEKANQRLRRILIGSSALTTGVLGLSSCGPSSTEIRPTPTKEPEAQTTIRPTPTPEPEAQPTNLVFTLAQENQNDPDFQKLNQANTSFFQEFKNRNPQNPWQLGETVALGAGNVDYALTTVVGPNGKPILGVVSYLDKDGKLQSGFAIDFVTTIPSDDGGRTFGGIYPLTPEISQLLLEGKTVTIDPKKDTQGPIFGFVLNKGKNWIDFSTAMTQATTEEQRKEVFSIYVDEIYLQKPDGKTHLFSISKLSPSEQTQLVSYTLPTATPASIELTPTPKPSPTPTITPTPRPTETPTPIPQINVGEIQLPDPRITNPELFNLKKKEAPIPQFANALKNAGIELSPEQIAQGITYVSTKEDGTPLVDKDGNPFVVAVYNLDPSLFPEQYRDLAGPIPLMIAKGGENGKWRWENIIESLRVFADSKNFPFGSQIVYYKLNDSRYTKLAVGNFNFFTSSGEIFEETLWLTNSPNEYRFDYSRADKIVNFARRNNATILWLHLFDTDPPEWVRALKEDEFINLIRLRAHDTLQHLRSLYPDGEIIYSVFNENFDWTIPRMPIKYVEEAFKQAREADPKAILLYNDVNVFYNGRIDDHDRAVMNLVRRIKQQGNLDGVGLQMHLNANNIPSPEVFRELIRTYKKLGVRVYITEFDIDFEDFRGSIEDKQLLKAKVYRNMLRVAMEEEVDGFAMFGFSGVAAWHPDGLIFDENSQPTAAFYAVASELYRQTIK